MAYLMISKPLLVFIQLLFLSSVKASNTYNIVSLGAKPDGVTDSTKALLGAWAAACSSAWPASTIYVPPGSFLIGQVVFQGPCTCGQITIQINGRLVAPTSFSKSDNDWLLFNHVNGVSVSGGTLDGRGKALWDCKAKPRHSCARGATTLRFIGSRNIVISNLKSIDSQLFHIVFDGCQNVMVRDVAISAPGSSPNTDGIHVEQSDNVTVSGAAIGTGDDCISIGPGTTNLRIESITCGPGHGISIGSLGQHYKETGVVNVTVSTVTFTGSDNGVRIKTWGHPSQCFVDNVVFEHVVMNSVHNPVIIDQNYCKDHNSCTHQSSGVKIRNVVYRDIKGTSATKVAVNFNCSASNPCEQIKLMDIDLTYKNKPAESYCDHAIGSASGVIVPPSCL